MFVNYNREVYMAGKNYEVDAARFDELFPTIEEKLDWLVREHWAYALEVSQIINNPALNDGSAYFQDVLQAKIGEWLAVKRYLAKTLSERNAADSLVSPPGSP